MKTIMTILMLSCLFHPSIVLAENSVSFEATGSPSFLSIVGSGGSVTGSPVIKDGKVSGKFECDLSKLDAGLEKRTEHMQKKYLETENPKFRIAKFILEPVALPKQGYFNFSGNLTLHGVSKRIEGVAFLDGKQVEAKFSINTSEFKIEKATHLGIGVEDKINVVVRVDL